MRSGSDRRGRRELHPALWSVTNLRPPAAALAVLWPVTGLAVENSAGPLEEVIVVAPYGARLPAERVPASVQTATADDIERAQTLDVTDLLNRTFGSVNVNHAQNNPLQPDVNFRGFTASPLLGLSPGLTVYQNGVRINEPFGDTVSWDLIPMSAVQSVQLMGGANPVFGLNTLGGALSLQMKNGFEFERTEAEGYAGSYERRGLAVEAGGNDGARGYYANLDYFEETGWRDYSRSDALRFFGVLSLREAQRSTLDLSFAYADTKLRGNGPAPFELLALDRSAVFTHPDITENRLMQVILEGSRQLGRVQLSGNAFYRRIDTDTFNGDATNFEECTLDGQEWLVEEDFTDVDGDELCTSADEDVVFVLDEAGSPIPAERDETALNAVNNLGRREQDVYGVAGQLALDAPLAGFANNLLIGAAYSEGRATFSSDVEIASLLSDRSTAGASVFAAEFATDARSEVAVASVYFTDTLSLSKRTALTLAGRYNDSQVTLRDRSQRSPELNGSHNFARFNPSAGLTVQIARPTTLYMSYSESTRAPTPVELACASEDAPCNLPNAFLADPPLDQVVARSIEAGLRGSGAAGLKWRAGVFRTTNEDDILFQTSGGAQANVGFFANVGDTRRQGVELSLSQQTSRVSWSIDYSLIEATFEDEFIVNSPNHPIEALDPAAPDIAGDDKLRVAVGDAIPGVPRHQANAELDVAITPRVSVGADVVYRSGVYLRGDEANLLDATGAYTVVNVRGEYRLSEQFTFFARIENVFDREYETFGLLGQPDEVFPEYSDPRFLGAGPPFGMWVGVKVRL